MIFKIKRKTTWGNYYNKKQGTCKKPLTKIKLTLLGLIPIKVLHRYRKEYNGLVIGIDKNDNPIYTNKTRQKFIKAKIKHTQTRDFVIDNLKLISLKAENKEAKKIADFTIKQLQENKDFILNI